MQLLIRFGPAPGATEDADGNLHSTFTGAHVMTLNDEAADVNTVAFIHLVAAIWERLTSQGHGHMLVGSYDGFEYRTDGAACGLSRGVSSGKMDFAPKNYVPLYAIARTLQPAGESASADGDVSASETHVDLGLDYRGTAGPGDEALRPVIFDSAKPEEARRL